MSTLDFDLIIQGGTLVTSADQIRADLGIRNGLIAAIGLGLTGHETIDATGKLVIPGAVDPHVHLDTPVGFTTTSDDWESGTIAAACGGTTTVIDFIEPESDESLLEAFEKRCDLAARGSVIDFSLHMTVRSGDKQIISQIPEVIKEGLTSFKLYTTYQGFRLSDSEILDVFSTIRAEAGLAIIHSENDAIIDFKTRQFLQEGKTGPSYHPQSRPDIAEGEAIHRVLALANFAGIPAYIVHISTRRGVHALKEARSRGQPAFGETCPQYLVLTDEEFDKPGFEGAKFVCSPPLRKKSDQEALWDALANGDLQTVGTDHCPFNFKGQKELGRDRFVDIPGGLPGIEARLGILFSFGVRQNRLSLHRWVDACCTAPARLFGLYPRKGTLNPGADADIVIFDPEKKVILSHKMLHERVDYTPYEGIELHGFPVMTIARGEIIVSDGQYIGKSGRGQFLRRSPQKITAKAYYE
jgi:dihydropyrimidinase